MFSQLFISNPSLQVALYLFLVLPGNRQSLTAMEEQNHPVVLAIHGGAGVITRKKITPELEKVYREQLEQALTAGYKILKNGGKSCDAVEAAIVVMEDSPLFNAGKGVVFTSDGANELDASIMDGATLQAGAAATVKHIKNPISLARLVLEKSPHIFLVGSGAEEFALEHGLEWVSQSYFYTKRRWQSLELVKSQQTEHTLPGPKEKTGAAKELEIINNEKSTVGAVALDNDGNLAAGTSTGGITNKMFGRVGDSPIIGAGTYANNLTCAVSCTGDGEYFMRLLAAYDVHALMAYRNLPLKQAVTEVIMRKLGELGGRGGLIAIDKNGNCAMIFNTRGMYRGYVDKAGRFTIKIFKNE